MSRQISWNTFVLPFPVHYQQFKYFRKNRDGCLQTKSDEVTFNLFHYTPAQIYKNGGTIVDAGFRFIIHHINFVISYK